MTAAIPDAFALELRRMLDELGLDIDMNGAIVKVEDRPYIAGLEVGKRGDMALGKRFYERLRASRPRGVVPAAEPLDDLSLSAVLPLEIDSPLKIALRDERLTIDCYQLVDGHTITIRLKLTPAASGGLAAGIKTLLDSGAVALTRDGPAISH